MPTYTLSVQSYLDQHNKCYRKILTINTKPTGPLSEHIKQINAPKLSSFKEASVCCPSNNCMFAITNINCNGCSNDLMCVDDIPNLFSFLSLSGYTIDTSLTKLMQKSDVRLNNDLLCFISI
jgi:hypothetical protein